jgi:hypothetical protein
VHGGVHGAKDDPQSSVVPERLERSVWNPGFGFENKFCCCQDWPPISSICGEVDVDAPILVTLEDASPEVCVECGLRVLPSPVHQVLVSVLRDREKFAAPPPDVPPPPPPPETEDQSNAGVSVWSDDRFLSRELPVSVDSPPDDDSDSLVSLSGSSDRSTVIFVNSLDDDEATASKACEEPISFEGRRGMPHE